MGERRSRSGGRASGRRAEERLRLDREAHPPGIRPSWRSIVTGGVCAAGRDSRARWRGYPSSRAVRRIRFADTLYRRCPPWSALAAIDCDHSSIMPLTKRPSSTWVQITRARPDRCGEENWTITPGTNSPRGVRDAKPEIAGFNEFSGDRSFHRIVQRNQNVAGSGDTRCLSTIPILSSLFGEAWLHRSTRKRGGLFGSICFQLPLQGSSRNAQPDRRRLLMAADLLEGSHNGGPFQFRQHGHLL